VRLELEFVLGINHNDFTPDRQEDFLRLISTISGASVDTIWVERVRTGCVTIVISLDGEAAEKLLAAIVPRHSDAPLADDQKLALIKLWEELKLQYDPKVVGRVNTDSIKSTRRNIIFLVHGWLGGEASFGNLPKFLEAATGCECRVFTYPTGFFTYSAPMAFLARALDNWIRNELYQTDVEFAIISHSMGGVIVRDFLSSQLVSQRPIDNRVRQVTFLASPLSGAWLAKLVRFFPGSANAQVGELAADSPYLVRVTSTWHAWLSRQSQLRQNIRSIFSMKDEVVDYVSAIGTDPEAIPMLEANHTNITKPKGADDEIVKTLTRLMAEAEMFGAGIPPATTRWIETRPK